MWPYILLKSKIVKNKLEMMNSKKIYWFKSYKTNRTNYNY